MRRIQKNQLPVNPDGFAALHRDKLSDRECQILDKLVGGKTVTEIAKELFLCIKTVSTYKSRLLEKMGCKTIIDLLKVHQLQGEEAARINYIGRVVFTKPDNIPVIWLSEVAARHRGVVHEVHMYTGAAYLARWVFAIKGQRKLDVFARMQDVVGSMKGLGISMLGYWVAEVFIDSRAGDTLNLKDIIPILHEPDMKEGVAA